MEKALFRLMRQEHQAEGGVVRNVLIWLKENKWKTHSEKRGWKYQE